MSITFEKIPLDWKNKGVELPETLKEEGFVAGYKPAASYFNYEWALVNDCLKELQVKLSDYATLNDQEKESLSAAVATKLDSSEFTADKIIEILNAASGSSGGGLNADTLDGKGSEDFAEAAHTHSEFENMVSIANDASEPGEAIPSDADLLDGHPASYFATSEHTHTSYYSSTLSSSGWSSSAPYTQTVAVAGILASDNPIIDVVLSDDASTAQSQLEAWGEVNRIITSDGNITAYCYEKVPTIDLPINLMCVR